MKNLQQQNSISPIPSQGRLASRKPNSPLKITPRLILNNPHRKAPSFLKQQVNKQEKVKEKGRWNLKDVNRSLVIGIALIILEIVFVALLDLRLRGSLISAMIIFILYLIYLYIRLNLFKKKEDESRKV
jgi:hypothetical protein